MKQKKTNEQNISKWQKHIQVLRQNINKMGIMLLTRRFNWMCVYLGIWEALAIFALCCRLFVSLLRFAYQIFTLIFYFSVVWFLFGSKNVSLFVVFSFSRDVNVGVSSRLQLGAFLTIEIFAGKKNMLFGVKMFGLVFCCVGESTFNGYRFYRLQRL